MAERAAAPDPRPLTEVAAGVILRGNPEQSGPEGERFLLAQRPPGKAYAGYWEFPGGKVEAGETPHDALCRELHEELGMEVRRAHPWLVREFSYPHARVRLNFFRVREWSGELHPKEHSGLHWQAPREDVGVAPMLPANAPILKALALPPRYLVTRAGEIGVAAELARIELLLAGGLRLIQVRDKNLAHDERAAFAHAVVGRARAYGARVLVNDDAALAAAAGADGVHFSAAKLAALDARPDFADFDLVAASCHDAAELDRAEMLGCDFAVLGPVLPTASHPGRPGMGWTEFARLAAGRGLPVYALGGMRREFMETAWAHGAHGIALMRGDG